MLVNQAGEHKGELPSGERKSLQTDRVILVPGPAQELETIRWVYAQFTREGKREAEIAADLNARDLRTDLGRPWTRSAVRQLLTNEKYIGHNVYNRTSFKLKKRRVQNTPDMWVRADDAFDPVVSAEDFFVARGIFAERARRVSSEDMIAHLRRLGESVASVSAGAIDADENMPSSTAYRSWFGSLLTAYRLAGITPERDYGYVEVNRALRGLHPSLIEDLTRRLGEVGATVTCEEASERLLINGEYTATVVLSRCRRTVAGSLRWLVRVDQRVAPDITILVRMDADNTCPADYYLLPLTDIEVPRLMLCETNGAHLDTYQFDTLDHFAALAARSPLEDPL
jgi:hypothetical protein